MTRHRKPTHPVISRLAWVFLVLILINVSIWTAVLITRGG